MKIDFGLNVIYYALLEAEQWALFVKNDCIDGFYECFLHILKWHSD